MRIPDVEGLKDAHEALNASNITVPSAQLSNTDTNAIATSGNPAAVLGQPQSIGSTSAVLSAANGTTGSPPAEKQQVESEHVHQLNERQSSCPRGKAFYKCQNGFTGCCSVDPCNPGSTCPNGQKASDEGQTATNQQGGGHTALPTEPVGGGRATQTQTGTATRTGTNDDKTTATGIRTATPTGTMASTTSRRVPRPTASAAPNCPRANGRMYTDGFKIPYRIRCNSDNTFDSFDSIAVGTGGYDQCFSACSQSEKCAGFTYVGLDSGDCYLKAQMPNGTYETQQGRNYIACAKLDPEQSAGNDPNGANEPAKKSTGAIVGGVVGGVVFLGLLLLLVVLLARRRRKKVEIKRRGTVTHVFHGPIETDMTQQPQPQPPFPPQQGYGYAPGYAPPGGQGYQHQHQRQGSTSHDVFTPYGGYYQGTDSTIADSRVQGMASNANQGWESSRPGEAKVIATLPASIYRAPAAVNTSTDRVAMLDGTPISRGSRGSRSPRFREHLSEMEDTSPSQPYAAQPQHALPSSAVTRIRTPVTDSPTLGRQQANLPQPQSSLADDVRRKQHFTTWNNYDAGHANDGGGEAHEMEATMTPKTPPASATQLSPVQVSPDTVPEPSDGRFVVSPYGSLERSAK